MGFTWLFLVINVVPGMGRAAAGGEAGDGTPTGLAWIVGEPVPTGVGVVRDPARRANPPRATTRAAAAASLSGVDMDAYLRGRRLTRRCWVRSMVLSARSMARSGISVGPSSNQRSRMPSMSGRSFMVGDLP